MHKLGAELGVQGMSLYSHVENKDALHDGIVEAMSWEAQRPPAEGTDWRDALRHLAGEIRSMILRHPAAAPLPASRPVMPVRRLEQLDAYTRLLMRAGFTEDRAVDVLHTALVLLAFWPPGPAGLAAIAAGYAVIALTYGALGLLLGVLVKGDLEGFFLIIMSGLVDTFLQNPLGNPWPTSPSCNGSPAAHLRVCARCRLRGLPAAVQATLHDSGRGGSECDSQDDG